MVRAFFTTFIFLLLFSAAGAGGVLNTPKNAKVPLVPEIPFVLIESENAVLYESDSGTMRAVTSLPKTYYALIDEEGADYYKVLYGELNGYMKKTDVQKVDYEPVTKFAAGTLRVSADVTGINVRARPDHISGEVLGEAKYGAELIYYGKIPGTAPDQKAGDEWFYVKFTDENGDAHFGYVYAPYVTATAIPANILEKVMTDEEAPPKITLPSGEWPPYLTAVFIGCLCIPAVAVMALLFKKPAEPKKTPRSF